MQLSLPTIPTAPSAVASPAPVASTETVPGGFGALLEAATQAAPAADSSQPMARPMPAVGTAPSQTPTGAAGVIPQHPIQSRAVGTPTQSEEETIDEDAVFSFPRSSGETADEPDEERTSSRALPAVEAMMSIAIVSEMPFAAPASPTIELLGTTSDDVDETSATELETEFAESPPSGLPPRASEDGNPTQVREAIPAQSSSALRTVFDAPGFSPATSSKETAATFTAREDRTRSTTPRADRTETPPVATSSRMPGSEIVSRSAPIVSVREPAVSEDGSSLVGKSALPAIGKISSAKEPVVSPPAAEQQGAESELPLTQSQSRAERMPLRNSVVRPVPVSTAAAVSVGAAPASPLRGELESVGAEMVDRDPIAQTPHTGRSRDFEAHIPAVAAMSRTFTARPKSVEPMLTPTGADAAAGRISRDAPIAPIASAVGQVAPISGAVSPVAPIAAAVSHRNVDTLAAATDSFASADATEVAERSDETPAAPTITAERQALPHVDSRLPLERYLAVSRRNNATSETVRIEASEKFAAPVENIALAPDAKKTVREKETVTIGKQDVGGSANRLGTNVAKTESAMPALFSYDSQSPVFRPEQLAVERVTPVAFEPFARDFTGAPVTDEHAMTARRAVGATLETIEQFSSPDGHGVNLKFSISGADLSVHVAMRGGAIHTTFRTDSPELRSSLAQEWQSMTSGIDDRAQRFAEPVFSAPGHGQSATDAGAQHREGRARQGEPSFAPARFPGALASAAATESAGAAVSSPLRLAPSTSQRLHAFA